MPEAVIAVRSSVSLPYPASISTTPSGKPAARRPDLLEGDLRLGLEGDLLRYLGLAPEALILRPILRKIEPISHRKAGITAGQRQRHCHLTVILLTELTAILAGYPDRVPPLLGKTGVIDDPGFDRPDALDHQQHQFAHLIEHGRIRPRRIADKMKQRLVFGSDLRWGRYRRHRFDARALDRHQQPQAVIMHRLLPIGMAQHRTERLDIGGKARFTLLA